MFKIFSFFITVFVLMVMFVAPVRNYLNNLFLKDKAQLKEEQIIGTVSGYSPRVEEIQKILKDAHFDPGPADGIIGSQTRKAIREFQKEKGLRPSGKVDSETQLELNREEEGFNELVTQPLVLPSGDEPREIKSKSKEEIVRIMGPQDEAIEEKLSKDRKKQIQVALQKSGFYKGKIDGKIGPQTKRAIKAFQKANGLEADGIVGKRTAEKLNKYLP
jgi:peptidoglycan hydrolase-like protein with peptidoglycan-binding domain